MKKIFVGLEKEHYERLFLKFLFVLNLMTEMQKTILMLAFVLKVS